MTFSIAAITTSAIHTRVNGTLHREGAVLVAGRMGWMFAGFVVLLATVSARLIAIEVGDGSEYRAVADEPIVHKQSIPAMRGRILAGDGTVLACDEPVMALAVNYRWLEQPANARWLRRTARSRLSAVERRDSRLVAAEQQRILAERDDLAHRLTQICGISDVQWQARVEQIQRRVHSMSESVNVRHQLLEADRRSLDEGNGTGSDASLPALVGRSIVDALFAVDHPEVEPPIVIAEEVSPHVMFEGLPVEAVAEIETNTARYPGIVLQRTYRRAYPQGDLAAHALGYLGHVSSDEQAAQELDHTTDSDAWIGRSGLERQYESLLRANRGLIVDQLDVRGVVHHSESVRLPTDGRDLVTTLDPALQRSAQSLLDQALARRLPSGDDKMDDAAGGAIVAIDIRNGAVLAAASAPRFDPNLFVQQNSPEVRSWLNDPARPLFDRTVQMALPPGSVFKIISAAAILASGVDPRASVECQGYLHQPEALRCAIYRRLGIGHGPVTVIDALARSCNVYFFHHAEQLGAAPILNWAARFGLAAKTGVDLPGEVTGKLPKLNDPNSGMPRQLRFDELPIAIGQSTITATPLQMVRVVAAIANGGRLVTPHLAARIEDVPESTFPSPRPIPGLDDRIVSAIRSGLRQAVSDSEGTAHATVGLASVTIAGKTGTAETGRGQPEHAWFAGYVPADQPRVAFVVVIEHAGNADTAAGPVAQHLVERMVKLGYFSRTLH